MVTRNKWQPCIDQPADDRINKNTICSKRIRRQMASHHTTPKASYPVQEQNEYSTRRGPRTMSESSQTLPSEKIFNDPIHGNIPIHPLCVKIIDTPQFQRLRFIKQLGAVQFVYPGAAHSRFEHSIGVCYLAGKWVRKLRKTLPEDCAKDVTDIDVLCVMVAGLCHDMGHGPFSHMYEHYYLRQIKSSPSFKHEEQSVKMFQYMILANDLERTFLKWNLGETEINFVKGLINPEKVEMFRVTPGKRFLYQIVCNAKNGIDVDKWDYFARDCLQLNITNSFDYKRLLRFSRVCKSGDSTEICFRDKEAENLYKMFELRYDLHRQAYQHKVTHLIHIMFADAMEKANGNLCIRGEKWYYCEDGHPATKRSDRMQAVYSENDGEPSHVSGEQSPSSSSSDTSLPKFVCQHGHEATMLKRRVARRAADCIEDMAIFTNLNDSIVALIMQAEVDETKADDPILASQRILDNIFKRQLYLSFRTLPGITTELNEVEIKNDICSMLDTSDIDKKDLLIGIVELDFSAKDADPLKNVPVYKKNKPTELIKSLPENKRIRIVPSHFQQKIVYMIYKKFQTPDETKKVLKDCFVSWCGENGYLINE